MSAFKKRDSNNNEINVLNSSDIIKRNGDRAIFSSLRSNILSKTTTNNTILKNYNGFIEYNVNTVDAGGTPTDSNVRSTRNHELLRRLKSGFGNCIPCDPPFWQNKISEIETTGITITDTVAGANGASNPIFYESDYLPEDNCVVPYLNFRQDVDTPVTNPSKPPRSVTNSDIIPPP